MSSQVRRGNFDLGRMLSSERDSLDEGFYRRTKIKYIDSNNRVNGAVAIGKDFKSSSGVL